MNILTIGGYDELTFKSDKDMCSFRAVSYAPHIGSAVVSSNMSRYDVEQMMQWCQTALEDMIDE